MVLVTSSELSADSDLLFSRRIDTLTFDTNMSLSSSSFISVATSTALSGLSAMAAYSNTVQSSVVTSSSSTSSSSSSNSEVQQSTITINRSSLTGAAIFLKIDTAANAQVKGVVKINGQVVASLPSASLINLTSCLHQSTCEIDIAGTYLPTAAVKTEIYSTNNTLRSTLQSSGSGMLHQKMVLNII